jgi:hypothetical protein
LVASTLGAGTALAIAVTAMAMVSAVLVGSAKYAVGLVGGSLGAPLQLALGGRGVEQDFGVSGVLGGVAESVNAKVYMHFPLTALAVIPALALFAGGAIAARHLALQSRTAHPVVAIGGLVGAGFAPGLLLTNLLFGGEWQSGPLSTLIWALLWGVASATFGALCQRTNWSPGAALEQVVGPANRHHVPLGVGDLAVAVTRVVRSCIGIWTVYAVALLVAGAFLRGTPVAAVALSLVVAVGVLGVAAARWLGSSAEGSAVLAAIPTAGAVLALPRPLRGEVLGLIVFLPGLLLASLYWAQGVAFHAKLEISVGFFGSGAFGSDDVGRIALWTGGPVAVRISLIVVPIMLTLGWHLFRAGHAAALRTGRPRDRMTGAIRGASIALLWSIVMLVLHPLASLSTGGT